MEIFLPKETPLSKSELLRYYHNVRPKLKYKDICVIMNEHHGIHTTDRQMKEFFRKNDLSRNMNVTKDVASNLIILELGTSANLFGYRQMTELLTLKYEINISRELVRQILKEVDPVGVLERRRRTIKRRVYESNGPWDIMHIDGNDKIKRFGFAIHGCIDGFSRKLMWLNVSVTNNDPLVIGNYYLNCIKRYKKVPSLLRMDKGTENVFCRDLQYLFTHSETSFLNAASTRNQRIESYWSRLKKFKLSWWIEFFDDMVKQHIYLPSNIFHTEAFIFSFMPVIQLELNQSLKMWNARNVRQSSRTPGGVPDILFNMPLTVGFENKGIDLNENDIKIAENLFSIQHAPMYKIKDLWELLFCYTQIHHIDLPQDPESALEVYVKLLELLKDDDFEV